PARRDLEARHCAGIEPAQHADLGIGEAELRLPDRQHDEEEVAVAVEQRVRAGSDAERAALLAAGRGRKRGQADRRSMKAAVSTSYARSPFWLTPMVRMRTTPHCGREAEGRISITSLEKVTVSPA